MNVSLWQKRQFTLLKHLPIEWLLSAWKRLVIVCKWLWQLTARSGTSDSELETRLFDGLIDLFENHPVFLLDDPDGYLEAGVVFNGFERRVILDAG